MTGTLTCLSCASKPCEKTDEGTFDICQYGISFLKRNNKIETKEPKVPLSEIAKNLRHEINPILQSIIRQTTELDPSLSIRRIDLNNPLSLIIGSTVILDNFIQMITGVHEFHSTPSTASTKRINLKNVVNTYYAIYGIVKEEGRTKYLKFNNLIPDNYYVKECSDFIKYIVAVLIDNAWKYSINNSTLTVNINELSNGKFRIKFTNKSDTIPPDINLFDMGTKLDKESKGFGYGLSWVKTLESHYNNLLNIDANHKFQIIYNQIESPESKISFQEFTLENIILEKT